MEQFNPLISIVVPNYNYGYLLPRVLGSVLSQLDDQDELIVVDDGSDDDSIAILASYTTLHPQIRVITQANSGAAAARNKGINAAHGRYVLLLDADDELLPGALARCRAVLKAHPNTGMILGGSISVYPSGKERLCMPTEVPNVSARDRIELYLLKKKISISHSCTLFRRDFLLECPYPEVLRKREDIPVFAYLLNNATVTLVGHPLARIYKHAGSLRHSRHESEEEVAQKMVDEVFSKLTEECQPLRRKYLAQCYLSLFRSASLLDAKSAWLYYRSALKLNALQALRWRYLRKVLRLRLWFN